MLPEWLPILNTLIALAAIAIAFGKKTGVTESEITSLKKENIALWDRCDRVEAASKASGGFSRRASAQRIFTSRANTLTVICASSLSARTTARWRTRCLTF